MLLLLCVCVCVCACVNKRFRISFGEQLGDGPTKKKETADVKTKDTEKVAIPV